MKFVFIFVALFSFNAYAENLSVKFLDSWFKEGSEACADADYGEFLLKFNPIKIMDITNDGIDDYILEEISGRCENSHSYFAGGTGGSHNRVYINLTIENFKFDNYRITLDKHIKYSNIINSHYKYSEKYYVLEIKTPITSDYNFIEKLPFHESRFSKYCRGYISLFN